MSRYNTQVLSSIRMLCRMQNIDEKVLYERAKLILSIYREVCWSTIDRANDVCDTLICTYGDSLDGALIYLENFAPDEARERFEERIRSLFETKWIIELVDMQILWHPPTVCRKWQECLGYIVRPFTISLPMKILSLSRLAGISELPKRALKNGITIRPATS